jgi:hypothetical protein
MAELGSNVQIDPNAVRTPRIPGLPTPRVANLEEAEVTPLRDVAKTLSNASEETNEVAKLYAKQAGYQAVQRDDQGNLVVAQAPIVGDAAIAFHAAVKFSALAMGESEAKQKDLVLSQTFKDNPSGYLEAAQAFKAAHVAQYAKAAGADVAAELGKTIDNATTTNYRFLVLQQQKKIRDDFDDGSKARIKSDTEDLVSLLESGAASTPDGQKQIAQLKQRIFDTNKLRVQNPALGEPADVAALRQRGIDLQTTAAEFVGGLNKILNNPDGGISVAQKAVDDQRDPKMTPNLTPAQRLNNYTEGQKVIKERLQNIERAAVLSDKAQKARDNAFFSDVMIDSATGANRITDYDIKTQPGVSPQIRETALAWKQRQGMPGPSDNESAVATVDLIRRINLPDGDPQKIDDPSKFRGAYAPPGGGMGTINYADEQKVEKAFKDANNEENKVFNKQKERLISAAKFDRSTLMDIDKSGKMAELEFRDYVEKRIEQYTAQKKDPTSLLTPGSPDFIGKPEIINYFRHSAEQQMQNVEQQLQGKGKLPIPPGLPGSEDQTKRRPGESLQDYDKRMGR